MGQCHPGWHRHGCAIAVLCRRARGHGLYIAFKQVGRDNDRQYARHCESGLSIDGKDIGMRMRATHKYRMGAGICSDVVDVAATAGQKTLIFPTQHRLTDSVLFHLCST